MPAYRSRASLFIGGIARRLVTMAAGYSMLNGIATFSATIDRDDDDPPPNTPIEARMGLDSDIRVQFTGRSEEQGLEFYPSSVEIAAQGPLRKARRRVNTVDLTWPGAVPDPDLPTPEKLAYWAVGKTDIEHVAALLELAGITAYDLEGTGEIVGDINPVTLPTGGNPYSLIQEIDRFTWYRTFDGPDGIVVRRPYTTLPSAGAAMTLSEGVDLYRGNRIVNTSQMITNVHIVGTSYMGADDWPIVIEFATDNPEENEYGINDVLEYQSELFETEAQAEAWAAIAMGEYGVLQQRYRWTLMRGIPNLRAGMTIAIESAYYGLTDASRWLVEVVRHYTDGTEYLTAIEVRGSADPSATSGNLKPVPVIKISIHREWIDGEWVDTVGLDARDSFDPDGPAIGAFDWDGDPVVPVPIGDGMTATATYAGGIDNQTPDPPTVTLAVMDLMGATATRTFPIVESADTPIQTRDMWLAVSDALLYSPDGGRTYESFAVAAVGCVREVPGYQLAWTAAGALYKVVAGEAPTLLTPTAITCAFCSYSADSRDFTGKAVAGGSDGKVWRSIDAGATWAHVGTLPGALTTISESPYAEGQIQATAGDALYDSFDAGANWVVRYQYGNVAMLATDFSAGFGKGLVGFSGGDTSKSHVQERDNAITVTFPVGLTDSAVRAITVSPSEQLFWVLATDDPGTGKSYQGDLLAGGELVEKDFDGVLGEPWDMIRDPLIEGLIYFIQNSSVGKTLDGFDTVTQILGLTGGQAGRKLGIGPLRNRRTFLVFRNAAGTGKVLYLGSGPSYSPPANWETVAFVDSGWSADVASSFVSGIQAFYSPISGGAWTTGYNLDEGAIHHDHWLYRLPVALPAGTIVAATLTLTIDDIRSGENLLYVNGVDYSGDVPTSLPGSPPWAPWVVTIDPADLATGANVIAMQVPNNGGPSGIQLLFEVTVG